jgi:hypothetical protein
LRVADTGGDRDRHLDAATHDPLDDTVAIPQHHTTAVNADRHCDATADRNTKHDAAASHADGNADRDSECDSHRKRHADSDANVLSAAGCYDDSNSDGHRQPIAG